MSLLSRFKVEDEWRDVADEEGDVADEGRDGADERHDVGIHERGMADEELEMPDEEEKVWERKRALSLRGTGPPCQEGTAEDRRNEEPPPVTMSAMKSMFWPCVVRVRRTEARERSTRDLFRSWAPEPRCMAAGCSPWVEF